MPIPRNGKTPFSAVSEIHQPKQQTQTRHRQIYIDFNLKSLLRSEAAAVHVLVYVRDTNKTI